jgi:hypothetical protein
MKLRKHAELIKAWADGETIEMFTDYGTWEAIPHPSWMSNMEYRIKWVSLTDIEMLSLYNEHIAAVGLIGVFRAIEAKLKEKNT